MTLPDRGDLTVIASVFGDDIFHERHQYVSAANGSRSLALSVAEILVRRKPNMAARCWRLLSLKTPALGDLAPQSVTANGRIIARQYSFAAWRRELTESVVARRKGVASL